jgi:hypothetical protein
VPITVKVSPKEASVVSYQYNVNSLNLKVGETATVKVTAVYSDGTTKDVTNRVGLTITDSYIADISGGTVIGKSVGTTTITMTTATESVSIPPPIAVRVNANYKPGGLIFQEITVKPNADVSSYYVSAEKGDTLVLAITVDTTETAVGDDKFILWTALSEGYSWNQIGACYVDGGTIGLVPLVLNLEKNERLGVALFHSDKYYSGASISDNYIFVTVKDG